MLRSRDAYLFCLLLASVAAYGQTIDTGHLPVAAVHAGARPPAARRLAPPPLMPPETHAAYRKRLPAVADRELQAILNDPRLLLYTEAEMPRCYQDWSGALQGVHDAYYNISAEPSEPFGNANLEFPWDAPAGTHRVEGLITVRFLWLPPRGDGTVWPVVWYRRQFEDDNAKGYAWVFPAGTRVGEVLMMRAPAGEPVAFELRVRERFDTVWEADVFRPFPRAADLAERLMELRPDWRSREALTRIMQQLTGTEPLQDGELTAAHPGQKPFSQRMGVDSLPPLEDDPLVWELLATTPFRSAQGETWRRDAEGRRTVAPTTQAAFHIVPPNYDGGFVDVDRISCMRCHETANVHVRRFEFPRDWYGRVRGGDGIFSFHPFALESISRNGFPLPVAMRPELISAGWLEPFDPRVHPRARYHRIPELDR